MLILIIDDEPALREILASVIAEAGHEVDQAATCAEARGKLARRNVDVALCDIQLPDGNGIDLVRESKAAGVQTSFIMVTAFGSMETAVEALRAGAEDFVSKPVLNEELLHRIAQLERIGELQEENQALRKSAGGGPAKVYRFTSPSMLEVERLVARVAPTASTVLITGESGTGKGVVARMIHEQSARRNAPFLAVNCSAIPEQLLEDEFFGHMKGAFTSATSARKGLLLQAEKGTLFLDEIGELPLHMQSKLLNVIEDKEVRPVGSEQSRRVDTRIIAATNRNLQECVARGEFREDLYFRLSTFEIPIPPLRARQQDIRGYLDFLLRSGAKSGTDSGPARIDALAEEALVNFSWPGNVRQFENVITRAKILANGDTIMLGDLPSEVIAGGTTPGATEGSASGSAGGIADGSLRERVRKYEADLILKTLEEAGGDRKAAAERLGIAVSSLYRKLYDLGR
jgi:two-component system response regulator AtoC